MAIEIRELNIKVTLADEGSQSGNLNGATSNTGASASLGAGEKNAALIEEAVEKVLEILKARLER